MKMRDPDSELVEAMMARVRELSLPMRVDAFGPLRAARIHVLSTPHSAVSMFEQFAAGARALTVPAVQLVAWDEVHAVERGQRCLALRAQMRRKGKPGWRRQRPRRSRGRV